MYVLLRASYASHSASAELYPSPRQLCSQQLNRKVLAKYSLIILKFTAAPMEMSQQKKDFPKKYWGKNPKDHQWAEIFLNFIVFAWVVTEFIRWLLLTEKQQLLSNSCLIEKLQLQGLHVRLPSSVKNTETIQGQILIVFSEYSLTEAYYFHELRLI